MSTHWRQIQRRDMKVEARKENLQLVPTTESEIFRNPLQIKVNSITIGWA